MKTYLSKEERITLFEEVWTDPVDAVAKRYGVSGSALRKYCLRREIPVPPRGYWEKLRSGQKVKKPRLPKLKAPKREKPPYYVVKVLIGIRDDIDNVPDIELISKTPLHLYSEATRDFIRQYCSNLRIPDDLRKPHPRIRQFKKELETTKEWKRREREIWSPRIPLEEHHYPHERVLPIYVANKSLPRACRIMDAFLRGIDAFGGAIELNGDCMRNPELYVVLHHFRFRFRLQEMKTAAKVDVPYDPPRLELTIEFIDPESRRRTRTQSYTDTSESTVEQGLGNAFLYILESVDQRHGEYLLKMREQHRAWEEELRRMEIEKRIDQEKLKVRVLERMVDDWNRAKCIREMIERVKETLVESGGGETNSALAQWMDWASLKADWLDPTTEHIDEILGAREDFLLKLLNSSNDSLPRASSSRYDAYTPNIPRGYYINRHNQGK